MITKRSIMLMICQCCHNGEDEAASPRKPVVFFQHTLGVNGRRQVAVKLAAAAPSPTHGRAWTTLVKLFHHPFARAILRMVTRRWLAIL